MSFKQFKIKLFTTSLFLGMFQLTYADTAQNNDTAIQNAILVHINTYRQQHGLNALKMDERMVQEARIHSSDMATHKLPFGHTHFNQRIDRLHAQIKNSNAGAENVAYNYKDAQDVVKNWLRSPGHKQNIDGHYDLTGIGVARDAKGKLYFTQIFLRTGASNNHAYGRSMINVFTQPFFRKG